MAASGYSENDALRSTIPELQNGVTYYDVTNRVINCKILFFKIFRFSNSIWKNFNIVLELVTQDFLKRIKLRKIKFPSY